MATLIYTLRDSPRFIALVDADPLKRGLGQIGGYLDSLGLDHGALLIFDQRQAAGPLEERCETSELEHEGRRTRLLRP